MKIALLPGLLNLTNMLLTGMLRAIRVKPLRQLNFLPAVTTAQNAYMHACMAGLHALAYIVPRLRHV